MHSSLSILLVDDDAGVRSAARRQLERLGHRVADSSSTSEALDLVRRGRFDLVICDVVMPGLDGHEFLRAAREGGLQIPFIMMSGEAERQDIIAALRGGVADFLLKPFSRVDLKAAIDRALGRTSTGPLSPLPERATPSPPAERTPTLVDGPPEPGGDERPDQEDLRRRRQILHRVRLGGIALPVPGRLLKRVVDLSEQHAPDPEEVFRLLESDATLGRTVMQIALSPLFRGRRPPASVREAATRIGALRALTGAASVATRANYWFDKPGLARVGSGMWLSHYLTASIAELVADELGHPRPDRLQTKALFMSIGELVTLRLAVELWPDEVAGERLSESMARLIDDLQAEVGVRVLKDWQLPAPYVEMARLYAEESLPPDLPPVLRDDLHLVRVARHSAYGLLTPVPHGRRPPFGEPEQALADSLGRSRLDELARLAVARARQVFDQRPH